MRDFGNPGSGIYVAAICRFLEKSALLKTNKVPGERLAKIGDGFEYGWKGAPRRAMYGCAGALKTIGAQIGVTCRVRRHYFFLMTSFVFGMVVPRPVIWRMKSTSFCEKGVPVSVKMS